MSGEPGLLGVAANEISHYVPMLKEMYESIAERQDNIKFYTLESIIKALEAREMQLWIGVKGSEIECCMITEVRLYPAAKVMTVLFASGKGQAYFDVSRAVFKAYAKAMKCTHWAFGGRPGWWKVHGKRGSVSWYCYQEV